MASTSSRRGNRNSLQSSPQSPTSPQEDQQSVYDRLTKPELIGIQKYNDGIIREMFAQGVEVAKSVYLGQLLAEQQQIEARIQMMEQQTDEREAYLKSLPPLPEYILSVKNRAMQRPMVLRGRGQTMSIEEAAMLEKKHQDSQKKRPERPKDFGGVSEKEKHAIIMEYMNYRDSEEDDDDDESMDDEFWSKDGEQADDPGAVGGQWVDTNDIAHMISVDRERISAGGYYTNFIDEP